MQNIEVIIQRCSLFKEVEETNNEKDCREGRNEDIRSWPNKGLWGQEGVGERREEEKEEGWVETIKAWNMQTQK